MVKLQVLIENLSSMIARGDLVLERVRYPKLLLYYLKELRDTIGNDCIKESIASQVSYLIGVHDPKSKQKIMLNTCIYGPPGVGKTKMGVQLAKIWYALGHLGPVKTKSTRLLESFAQTLDKADISTAEGTNAIYFLILIAGAIYGILSPLVSYVYESLGFFYLVLGIILIAIGIYFLYIWYIAPYFSNKDPISSKQSGQNSSTGSDVFVEPDPRSIPDPSSFITIASREDLVGEYVGWTDKKVIAFLNANLGKAVFIDEAYSIINGHLDSFGFEALTTLNKYMSEHAGEIVIIFAGYKNLIERLFEAQPGLPRRFMWHFDCNGYNGEELYRIFVSQLAIDGWKIDPRDERDIEQLFEENSKLFPAFGGDTERLCFFSLLQYSEDLMAGTFVKHNTINHSHVERALELLIKNTKAVPETDKSELSRVLNLLR